MVERSGPGARGQLPQDDGAPEKGDPATQPGAQAHSGRERRHPAPHDHPRSRLLHSLAGEGRDKRHQPVPLGGPAGELRGSRPVYPQQRRRHPPWPHHQGGFPVAALGDGGGGSCPLQV